MSDERIEDVIEVMRAWCDGNMTHHPECGCRMAARLTAALERERAAIRKVADEIERGEWSIERGGSDRTPLACRRAWADELRRIAGWEEP